LRCVPRRRRPRRYRNGGARRDRRLDAVGFEHGAHEAHVVGSTLLRRKNDATGRQGAMGHRLSDPGLRLGRSTLACLAGIVSAPSEGVPSSHHVGRTFRRLGRDPDASARPERAGTADDSELTTGHGWTSAPPHGERCGFGAGGAYPESLPHHPKLNSWRATPAARSAASSSATVISCRSGTCQRSRQTASV
jgi:hypothetical protein